jgi:prepilin-type N-terminal cleavage/methylation domain-containing protein
MRHRPDFQRGFTLVEVLIGATLAAAMMAAVLSSFVFLGRSLTRLANYQTLEAKGREALTYFRGDFALARAVKNGTTPTASSVTLVLPAGEVTYTYDSAAQSLRRQANFGANQDFQLLQNDFCTCTTFTFNYYTTTSGAPTSQITPALNVPYSIKQIEVRFVLQTPGTASPSTQTRFEEVSSRFLVRNKQPPDGS